MAGSRFYAEIRNAREEREVDAVYTKGLNTYFRDVPITHPFKCDSYLETRTEKGKKLHLLVEYKYDENFASDAGVAKVLIQVVFYLKRFEVNGLQLPNVVLVGDKNECFVLQTNVLQDYLDYEDVDWDVAPSEAHEHFPHFVAALARDEKISPFVHDVNDSFSFKTVAESIVDQADNVQRIVRVTEHNIRTIYDHFCNRVLKDQTKIHPNNLVSMFMGVILDGDNYYQHPRNPNRLVIPGGNVDIVGSAFTAFISVFSREYTSTERRKFAETSDRLIEETKRRRSGEFYTPTPFVDYAHRMLEEELGEGWKEEYVVWDCCWGTGNLTRDYRFKELYASTLEPSELAIGSAYNREATKFIFDFLNDEIEDFSGIHIPEGLYHALKEDRPIVFFINPPYARPGKSEKGGGTMGTEKGTANTVINALMKENDMGACCANLYPQFIYRILCIKRAFHLTNVAIGLYSPTLYLGGSSYSKLRRELCELFEFKKGIVFQASHFADVKARWAISFTVWKSGSTVCKTDFLMDIIEDTENGLAPVGQKNVYNLDESCSLSDWSRALIKGLKRNVPFPNMTNGIGVVDQDFKTTENAIGSLLNSSNSMSDSSTGVALFTGIACKGNNSKVPVIKESLLRTAVTVAAKKVVLEDWTNNKDEYAAPNEAHEGWNEFVNDSLVYSLFHYGGGQASNQSSLRNVDYKGKTWNIYNEFFFMPKQEIMDLAESNRLYDTYEDARTDKERYVYQLLSQAYLSAEARAVWEKACEITRNSFVFRELFNAEHPEYQILNWDCGWYQIKALAKQYGKKELNEFDQLYKVLTDKMRPMVYELGFLK